MPDSPRDSSHRTHLAIVHRIYLERIMAGLKTIESRFSKVRCPPYGVIAAGDQILFKVPGRAISARAHVASVLFFEDLNEQAINQITEQYGQSLQLEPDFLRDRRDARYCTLIFLEDVASIGPLRVEKRDKRGWVVLPSSREQSNVHIAQRGTGSTCRTEG